MHRFLLCIFTILFIASPVRADELSELRTTLQEMQAEMDTMTQRVKQLEEKKQKPAALALQEEQAPFARTESRITSRLNPEISVFGDVVYHTTTEDGGELDNEFSFREVELAISANVDTYARGDFFISIEDEDGEIEVSLEEGYLTLLETPVDNLQARFGKFRPYFGKTNRMHLHNLPWTSYPHVIQNYLGHHGFSEAGVSLSYLLPIDVYSELTLEGLNNSGLMFDDDANGETVWLGHWKNFFETGDITTLEVGASHSFGENGNGNGSRTRLSGLDLTLNTELMDNRRTTSHTEVLFSKHEQDADDDIDSWGMFTSLEQQLTPQWWTFGRYDYSQRPTSSDTETNAYSAGFTFAQSEYVFWRIMYTRTDNNLSEDSDEVWLQLNFGIGPHRPHQYR